MRHAKILATLGPSSWDEDTVRKLIRAGANGFRLNFSHADHARHLETAKTVRKVAKEEGIEIALLQDLQGPKIRIGEMSADVILNEGDSFTLDSSKEIGTKNRVCLPHPEILAALQPEDLVYINDGVIRVQVTESLKGAVKCTVVNGGHLTSRKGVNIPGREIPLTALTEKDLKDFDFGQAELDIDWLALSFVQRPEDIVAARKRLTKPTAIISKIETTAAVDNIEGIIAVSDGIMVARGDLGVELPPEEVPPLQKKIIRLCREAGKPVIVATQMMESMITNPTPTRAEVSDVANATYEGADCVMLSAETAAGHHPVKVVEMMSNVIARVEASSAWAPLVEARQPEASSTVQDAITLAACRAAETIKAGAIVTFTESGSTAMRVSRWRPNCPLLCLTDSVAIARKLGLVWGARTAIVPALDSTDQLVTVATSVCKKKGYGKKGGHAVVTAGIPFKQTGTTNLLRVIEL